MNIKFMATCVALVCCTVANAQHTTQIPQAAKTAFAKAYPAATKEKWDKEDGNYEVSFHYKTSDMAVVYTAAGVTVETETKISVSSLPAAATSYATAQGKIKEASKIVKASGTVVYEAEVNGKDLLFDEKGSLIPASGK